MFLFISTKQVFLSNCFDKFIIIMISFEFFVSYIDIDWLFTQFNYFINYLLINN